MGLRELDELMALIHVYPPSEEGRHEENGADCWCEPEIRDEGWDDAGVPARVFVHRKSLVGLDGRWKPPRRRLGRG